MNRLHVVLIGFMGTGKSTVASALAERLGREKVDLDVAIEEAEGTTIPVIFAEKGEPYFRRAETEALRRVLEGKTAKIVATGGGAVLAEENRRLMLENGFVVALTADEETIVRRVKDDPNRPLLKGDVRERVATLLGTRKTAYDFAHMKIDTSHRTVDEIADAIVERLQSAK
jgi:shikimate kinase